MWTVTGFINLRRNSHIFDSSHSLYSAFFYLLF